MLALGAPLRIVALGKKKLSASSGIGRCGGCHTLSLLTASRRPGRQRLGGRLAERLCVRVLGGRAHRERHRRRNVLACRARWDVSCSEVARPTAGENGLRTTMIGQLFVVTMGFIEPR